MGVRGGAGIGVLAAIVVVLATKINSLPLYGENHAAGVFVVFVL